MRTRSQSRNSNRQQQQVNPTFVEPFNLVEPIENQAPPVVTMDDNRTMAQLLEAPTVGYEDAIVVPEITADNFELKHGLLTLVQNKQFFGHDKEDPHAHIRYFNKITSTMKFPNVPSTSNEITRFQQRFDETFYEAWDRFNDLLRACPHHGFSELHQLDTFYNALNSNDQDSLNSAAGGNFLDKMPRDCLRIIESKSKVHNSRNKPVVAKIPCHSNTASTSGSGTLPSNTITNPKVDLKGITTRSGVAYQGPTIPTTSSSLPKVVERETEPIVSPVSAPMPNPKSSIPYPSRRNDERRHEKANDQIEKFYEIFKDLSFEISLTDALILMPKFASTLKALIGNKEKLSEMARTPLNEHCSAVILNKLPKKLGDPGKFLIPCDFPGMDECLALADLGASINLMPLSVWKKLSLPELTPTCMTLELADRSITQPIGIAEDVYLKVGKFKFPADFVVVDFDADPRVPLILGRSFLKTGRALIDVYEGELTLRVGKEAVTFNLDQTSRYSSNYDDITVNLIDVIEMACEDYSQEVLGFSDVIASGNPTPYYDPIVSTSSPTLTPFGDSDFLLEEVDAFLALKDDPTSPEVDDSYYDPEGDILLLESFLNDDPSLPPPIQGNYLPEIRKELKDLPPHLEYAFLEGNNKLPVIIAKDLSIEEKAALKSSRIVLVKPLHLRSKKGGFTVVENDENELIPTRLVTGWRVCIDYRKLNEATRKDHFPLPFMDQMLERLAGNEYYCFLDGFSGYFQIPIDPHDQEKTTFTCPYGTFAYRRMPFGLCNAPGTFQRCMMAIFHDMIEKTMEVFMDDFSVFRNSFENCLSRVDKMLQRCEDTNLCLNWEKSHFMVKEGIVLGHKISKNRIEVDKAKVDVIAKLPHPTTVKGVWSFLGHAGFYRRFIKDFSKISRPMTHLLEKNTSFIFSNECIQAFETLKKKLTKAPILIAPDWDLPFELMCDASDFAIGAVLGQRHEKHFRPIHYASKTMNEAESHYTTTEKEMLAVVYAFEKFRSYLILNKSIVYTDHSALKYLFAKKDSKARLLRWVLLLQEFTFKVIDTKGAENLAADHLSRLENPYENVLDPKEAKKLLTSSQLAIVDPPGDITVPTTPPKKFLTQDFIGPPFTKMPMTWSPDVTLVSVKEKFRNVMKCLKIPSKFAKSLTCGASISWGRSRLHEGTNIYTWRSTICQKWVEAKALPTNDARVVCKFIKSLFARFGAPRAIISDRETHFCNDQFAKVMLKYGVTHSLSTAYHPQTSGHEVSNRGLKRILERTVGENRASWSDKLDDALWAFRTAYKTPIGCTPYKLVYEKVCHLPIELEHKAYSALKHANFNLETAGDHRKVQLNELNELRDHAYENSLIYKEKTKRIHDSKIKSRVFNVDDQVLLFNSRLKMFSGKLKSRWSRLFTIAHVFSYGTAALSQNSGPNFKVNGHRIKHYFGGDIPKLVVPDLQTFSKDK
ncbi:reverse transcriptase domain-containing protein [Tanacetum coccineum]